MNYTVLQLRHLRNIRAVGYDDYHDSGQTNEKQDFIYETDEFFDWLVKMEHKGKIKEMLSTMYKNDKENSI